MSNGGGHEKNACEPVGTVRIQWLIIGIVLGAILTLGVQWAMAAFG